MVAIAVSVVNIMVGVVIIVHDIPINNIAIRSAVLLAVVVDVVVVAAVLFAVAIADAVGVVVVAGAGDGDVADLVSCCC